MKLDKSFIEKVLFGKINLQESKYKIPENESSILIDSKCEIKRIDKDDFQVTFMTSKDEIFSTQTISLFKDDTLTLNSIGFTLTIKT